MSKKFFYRNYVKKNLNNIEKQSQMDNIKNHYH